MNPVAIIGGGITGLSAAFGLKQRGVPVRLFEAGDRLGGVIRTTREGGRVAEWGPNSILETSPLVSQLVSDLGLESRRCYSDPKAEARYIVRRHKLVAVPSSPWTFATTPLFSLQAKLRAMAEPFIGRPKQDWEESVAQFVNRRLGQEFLDYAINPMVAGIYAGNPHQLSVIHAFPKLAAVEQKYRSLFIGQFLGARERKRRAEVSKANAPKFSFDDGLEVLVEALETHLSGDIELSSPVRSIDREGDGWSLLIDSPLGQKKVACSAVLIATPAYRMAELKLQAPGLVDLSAFTEIHYTPVATVTLGFKRADVAHPLDGFGALVPEKENLSILGALFPSSLFPGRAPKGEVIITTYIGGARAPMLALRPEKALVETALADLKLLLGITGEPTFQSVSVFRRAIPQYNIGYGRFKRLMSAVESEAPGVFIAGHAREGTSVSDCIVSGHNVAERIGGFLGVCGRLGRRSSANDEVLATN